MSLESYNRLVTKSGAIISDGHVCRNTVVQQYYRFDLSFDRFCCDKSSKDVFRINSEEVANDSIKATVCVSTRDECYGSRVSSLPRWNRCPPRAHSLSFYATILGEALLRSESVNKLFLERLETLKMVSTTWAYLSGQ